MKQIHQNFSIRQGKRPRYRSRNSRINIRVSAELKKLLKDFWKDKTYPDPKSNKKEYLFSSENEFINYVLNCVCLMTPAEWYWFRHWHNPAMR